MKQTIGRDSSTLYHYVQVGVFVACLGVPAVHAQQDESNNPFANDPVAVAAGGLLYQKTCEACHGGEARGDRGPALVTGRLRHGNQDDDLEVSEEELTARRAGWKKPEPGMKGGYQQLYVDHVMQANKGADFDFLIGCRGAAVPREWH
jgi:hypothetical protein